MKLYAPTYYDDFKCITDRCLHNCCVGWEIDVDDVAREKYASLSNEYGEVIRNSIDYTDTPHFRLAKCDRCPHLNERGLCEIIINFGEEYLCDICREHPRFYNDTPHGREVGLGMSCEEACRIILSSDNYGEIVQIGEVDGDLPTTEFDAGAYRRKLYQILSDDTLSYTDRLKKIHNRFEITMDFRSDEEWKKFLYSLEYLDKKDRQLFSKFSTDLSTPTELEKPLERALAYFVYRHCSGAAHSYDFHDSLGLCLFCERLLASLAKESPDKINEFARIVSEEIEYSEDNTEMIKMEFFNWIR